MSVHRLVPEKLRRLHEHWGTEAVEGRRHDFFGRVREIEAQRRNGTILPCEMTVNEFQTAGERRLSIIMRDLTDRKKFEEKLAWLSYYDELTELPNRRLFRDRVEQAITLEAREEWLLAIIYIGLARFKMINDTLGQTTGDEVLKVAASRLRNILRASDTVARMGGDEFAVLLPKTDAGISIAIDDFGTGYSSLAYLKRLPAEWLKIDMAFIRGLPDDADDAAIVRSTIAMAHALGMRVLAEGLETESQLEFLRGEGCDAAQGYLLSKPLPADKASENIRRNLKKL
jgi:predicted signal transduction protein with EAL and GGDEF domain